MKKLVLILIIISVLLASLPTAFAHDIQTSPDDFSLLRYTEPKYEQNKEETSKFTLDFTVERFDLKMNETTG